MATQPDTTEGCRGWRFLVNKMATVFKNKMKPKIYLARMVKANLSDKLHERRKRASHISRFRHVRPRIHGQYRNRNCETRIKVCLQQHQYRPSQHEQRQSVAGNEANKQRLKAAVKWATRVESSPVYNTIPSAKGRNSYIWHTKRLTNSQTLSNSDVKTTHQQADVFTVAKWMPQEGEGVRPKT